MKAYYRKFGKCRSERRKEKSSMPRGNCYKSPGSFSSLFLCIYT